MSSNETQNSKVFTPDAYCPNIIIVGSIEKLSLISAVTGNKTRVEAQAWAKGWVELEIDSSEHKATVYAEDWNGRCLAWYSVFGEKPVGRVKKEIKGAME